MGRFFYVMTGSPSGRCNIGCCYRYERNAIHYVGHLAILVEERLEGREVSIFAICDGNDVLLMLPAKDHKRIGDGDTGLGLYLVQFRRVMQLLLLTNSPILPRYYDHQCGRV